MTTPRENIVTHSAYKVLEESMVLAKSGGDHYLTPEHILYVLDSKEKFRECLQENGYDAGLIDIAVLSFLAYFPSSHLGGDKIRLSRPLELAIENAVEVASERNLSAVDLPSIVSGIALLKDSLAGYILREKGHSLQGLLKSLSEKYK